MKDCVVCDTPFTATRQKDICSRACSRARYDAEPIGEKRCEHCGSLFVLTKGKPRKKFCSHKCSTDANIITQAEFIETSTSVHGNKYSYSQVEYKGVLANVIILCPIHGEFEQNARNHMRGWGCIKCGLAHMADGSRWTKERFVEEASKHHGNFYNYSKVEYRTQFSQVVIICPVHGAFTQMAGHHYRGSCCPSCTKRTSDTAKHWLLSMEIPIELFEKKLSTGTYADAYDPNTNTVYLFHGDFWHGNPRMYNGSMINPRTGKTMQEQYTKTLDQEQAIRDADYKLVVMWEKDWLELHSRQTIRRELFEITQ